MLEDTDPSPTRTVLDTVCDSLVTGNFLCLELGASGDESMRDWEDNSEKHWQFFSLDQGGGSRGMEEEEEEEEYVSLPKVVSRVVVFPLDVDRE